MSLELSDAVFAVVNLFRNHRVGSVLAITLHRSLETDPKQFVQNLSENVVADLTVSFFFLSFPHWLSKFFLLRSLLSLDA